MSTIRTLLPAPVAAPVLTETPVQVRTEFPVPVEAPERQTVTQEEMVPYPPVFLDAIWLARARFCHYDLSTPMYSYAK